MTRLRIDGRQIPVTLLQIVSQEVVRYKTMEKDGYEAAVFGVEKKELEKERGQKISYSLMQEFEHDAAFMAANPAGTVLGAEVLEGVTEVTLTGVSKGKGYQGVMKRFHAQGGPKTHGSKFHRHVGSMGNRKPRRTQKGHPHAGHMGNEVVTLHKRPLVDIVTLQGSAYVALRGSVPGAYNGYVSLYVA
jgi:large subunit ribosomal protein L3